MSTPITIEELTILVHKLYSEIENLKIEVDNLKKENSNLREELSIYKNKKNSNNSHVPPSQDQNRPLKNKSNAKHHQICTAHLLRELNYLNELYDCEWSQQFNAIIIQAHELKKS